MSTSSKSCENKCVVCQEPAKKFCSACKLVNYCGVEHQRKHWKEHKLNCQAFEVQSDEDLGRYLSATRDIKGGNIIFTECPLVVGSKWYCENNDDSQIVACVGCFSPCHIKKYQCLRCKWPSCSTNCDGLLDPKRHAIECKILSLGSGPSNKDSICSLEDYYRSDALIVLKCLLLQCQNEKKWKSLMDMQSHEEDRINSELRIDADKRIVSYLENNFLRKDKKCLKEFNSDILHRICGIIETNYMCISTPTGIELSGLYYNACMMEHSCNPNCYFQFDSNNNFNISVIAGKDIKKGEHLKIMYSNMLWATQMRHEHLTLTKHFICKCERCVDPTEFGTYFSALRCVGDCGVDCGDLQLPKEPLKSNTDWVCRNCSMLISGEEVRFLLTEMSAEVDDTLSSKPTINQLEELIEKLSKFLHSNHYLLFSLKHSLIQLYGKSKNVLDSSPVNSSLLDKKKIMCQELLDVCEKLDPYTIRLSIYVGIILFELHNVLVEQSRLLVNEDSQSNTDDDVPNSHIKQARLHLLRAIKVLKKEMDNVPGRKLNEVLFKALSELK